MSRIGIFQMSDKDGIVENYITYLLKDIRENVEELVVVVNGELKEKEEKKLEAYAEKIFFRENYGYDAYAFRETILDFLGIDYIRRFDELLLFNDTFYGPLYPFREVFDAMEGSPADFWGLTKHAATKASAPPMREHIQSYFLVFRHKMLNDASFQMFWETLQLDKMQFEKLVHQYEVRLTVYFASRGYRYEAYVKDDDLNGSQDYNCCHYLFSPYLLLKKYRMPVIKRKVFSEGKTLCILAGEEIYQAFQYIKEKTDYDINFIWNDLLRKCNISDLKDMLNWNYVLPKVSGYALPEDKKIAVVAHITYDELLDDCLECLISLPESIDIYVTSYKPGILEKVDAFSKQNHRENMKGKAVKNRGRDVSAIFLGCRDIVGKYEYLCFVHDKRTTGNKGFYMTGASFHHLAWENMVASPGYLKNIIQLFEENPRLGLLSPPKPLHWDYAGLIYNGWSDDYEICAREAERLELNVPMDETKYPFAFSTCFWCRTKALWKMFQYPLCYEDFKEEPLPMDGELNHALERIIIYVAQDAGYYSGIVESAEYAALDIQNLNMTAKRLWPNPQVRYKSYLRNKKAVYVYGAGIEGRKATAILKGMKKKIAGYLVSDDHFASCKSSLRPLLKLSEMPREGSGIIIAMNRTNTRAALKNLEKCGIDDFMLMNEL